MRAHYLLDGILSNMHLTYINIIACKVKVVVVVHALRHTHVVETVLMKEQLVWMGPVNVLTTP